MGKEVLYYLDTFEEIFFEDVRKHCTDRIEKERGLLLLLENKDSIKVMHSGRDYDLEEHKVNAKFPLNNSKLMLVDYKDKKVNMIEKAEYGLSGEREKAILYKVIYPNAKKTYQN